MLFPYLLSEIYLLVALPEPNGLGKGDAFFRKGEGKVGRAIVLNVVGTKDGDPFEEDLMYPPMNFGIGRTERSESSALIVKG